MDEKLAADAVCACLGTREIAGVLVGFNLEPADIGAAPCSMHNLRIALVMRTIKPFLGIDERARETAAIRPGLILDGSAPRLID